MPSQLKLSLPTRPFHLAIGALIEAIGGYKVAARICLVTQIAADEVMQEYFLNLYHRRCYPTEKVFAFIDMLQGQERKVSVNE